MWSAVPIAIAHVAPRSWTPPALARDVELYDLGSCEATGLDLAVQLTHEVGADAREASLVAVEIVVLWHERD